MLEKLSYYFLKISNMAVGFFKWVFYTFFSILIYIIEKLLHLVYEIWIYFSVTCEFLFYGLLNLTHFFLPYFALFLKHTFGYFIITLPLLGLLFLLFLILFFLSFISKIFFKYMPFLPNGFRKGPFLYDIFIENISLVGDILLMDFYFAWLLLSNDSDISNKNHSETIIDDWIDKGIEEAKTKKKKKFLEFLFAHQQLAMEKYYFPSAKPRTRYGDATLPLLVVDPKIRLGYIYFYNWKYNFPKRRRFWRQLLSDIINTIPFGLKYLFYLSWLIIYIMCWLTGLLPLWYIFHYSIICFIYSLRAYALMLFFIPLTIFDFLYFHFSSNVILKNLYKFFGSYFFPPTYIWHFYIDTLSFNIFLIIKKFINRIFGYFFFTTINLIYKFYKNYLWIYRPFAFIGRIFTIIFFLIYTCFDYYRGLFEIAYLESPQKAYEVWFHFDEGTIDYYVSLIISRFFDYLSIVIYALLDFVFFFWDYLGKFLRDSIEWVIDRIIKSSSLLKEYKVLITEIYVLLNKSLTEELPKYKYYNKYVSYTNDVNMLTTRFMNFMRLIRIRIIDWYNIKPYYYSPLYWLRVWYYKIKNLIKNGVKNTWWYIKYRLVFATIRKISRHRKLKSYNLSSLLFRKSSKNKKRRWMSRRIRFYLTIIFRFWKPTIRKLYVYSRFFFREIFYRIIKLIFFFLRFIYNLLYNFFLLFFMFSRIWNYSDYIYIMVFIDIIINYSLRISSYIYWILSYTTRIFAHCLYILFFFIFYYTGIIFISTLFLILLIKIESKILYISYCLCFAFSKFYNNLVNRKMDMMFICYWLVRYFYIFLGVIITKFLWFFILFVLFLKRLHFILYFFIYRGKWKGIQLLMVWFKSWLKYLKRKIALKIQYYKVLIMF